MPPAKLSHSHLLALEPQDLVHDPQLPSPAEAYLSSLSASGRRTQATALNNLAFLFSDGRCSDALTFPWQNLRYENTSALAACMVEIGYAKPTVNKHLVVLRRVLEEAYRLGLYADHDLFYRAQALKSLRTETIPRGRTLKMEELEALVACALADKNQALGVRDAALISTLYAAALRRQEIVDLNLADLELPERKLRILGKGSKKRLVYLSEDALKALEAWLLLRGRKLGPLFCRVTKGGKVLLRRLSPQAIYYLLQQRALGAGIEAFSPHDLRRSSITDLLSAEVDVLTVSAIAGHASADTTRRYDRRNEDTKREAAQRLRSPFRPRPETPAADS
ncbi:MAG: tyrosine-type recombinase/integrase [Anaerolineaceae bacterium]|nr:tyrosine-type recombinase/integrase [Anaerolineaceae bacterium]